MLGSVSFRNLNIWNAAPVAFAPLAMLPLGTLVMLYWMVPAFQAGQYATWAAAGYLGACCFFSGLPSPTDIRVGALSALMYSTLGSASGTPGGHRNRYTWLDINQQRTAMPKFDVRIYAVESEEFPGMFVGKTTVDAATDWEAAYKAKDNLWDDRLSTTCSPRFMVNSHEAQAAAALFLDAAPENTESADEYDWQITSLSRKDLEETGLLADFEQHAKNILLVPEQSDLSRPVVVTRGDDEQYPLAVWDGVHRIMSALALSHAPLPAILGIRKRDNCPE